MSRPDRWIKYSNVAFAGILAVLGLPRCGLWLVSGHISRSAQE